MELFNHWHNHLAQPFTMLIVSTVNSLPKKYMLWLSICLLMAEGLLVINVCWCCWKFNISMFGGEHRRDQAHVFNYDQLTITKNIFFIFKKNSFSVCGFSSNVQIEGLNTRTGLHNYDQCCPFTITLLADRQQGQFLQLNLMVVL